MNEYQRGHNDPGKFSSSSDLYGERGGLGESYGLLRNGIGFTKPLKMKMDSTVNDPLIIDSWWKEGVHLPTSSSLTVFFTNALVFNNLPPEAP